MEDSKGDSCVEPAVAGVVADEWPLCTGDLESSKPRFEELLRSPFVRLALSDSESALQQGNSNVKELMMIEQCKIYRVLSA